MGRSSSTLELQQPLAARATPMVAAAGQGRRRAQRVLLYGLVLVIAVWSLFPILYMLNLSLMDTADVLGRPPRFVAIPPNPRAWSLVFFGEGGIFKAYGGFQGGKLVGEVPQTMFNTFVVALGTTLLNLALGSLAGYGYARFGRFRFMQGTLIVLMVTRMLPGLALLIPFFIFYRTLGLIDTKIGLIVAYTSFLLPLTIWIMTNYFRTIPRTLEWAARVDGANWWQAFRRVFLPVAAPGLMAAGIFTFLVAWNEFLFALILTSTPAARTVTVSIAGIYYQFRIHLDDYPSLFASGVLAALPPLLIAFLLQRYLVQGMLSGSAKG
jgi:ABC-type glycerol-3-phosphate transport system permease component